MAQSKTTTRKNKESTRSLNGFASEVHCVSEVVRFAHSEVILRIVKFCLWQRAEEFMNFPLVIQSEAKNLVMITSECASWVKLSYGKWSSLREWSSLCEWSFRLRQKWSFAKWQNDGIIYNLSATFCTAKNFTASKASNFTYREINFTRIATSFTRIVTSFTRIALRLHATRRRAYVSNRTKKTTDFVESEKNSKNGKKFSKRV